MNEITLGVDDDRTRALLDHFNAYYPDLYDSYLNFNREGYFDLRLIMKDGTHIIYDDLTTTCRIVPSDPNNMSEQEFGIEVGFRLRKILFTKGVSQKELADAVELSQGQISNYINGKSIPNLYYLGKIAKYVECPIKELFCFSIDEL